MFGAGFRRMDPLAALDDIDDMSEEDSDDYELRIQSQLTVGSSSQSSVFSSRVAGSSGSANHPPSSSQKGNAESIHSSYNDTNKLVVSSKHDQRGAAASTTATVPALKMGNVKVHALDVKNSVSSSTSLPKTTHPTPMTPPGTVNDRKKGGLAALENRGEYT
jgi:hypothetical protein